jgi:hypothetical protein
MFQTTDQVRLGEVKQFKRSDPKIVMNESVFWIRWTLSRIISFYSATLFVLLDNNGKPDFHLVCEKNENVFKSILLLIYVGTLDGGVVTCYSKNLKNSESEKCFSNLLQSRKVRTCKVSGLIRHAQTVVWITN